MNTSGAYYDFREKLKRSVVRLVREEFAKDASFATGASSDMDAMTSKLYIRLMGEVHRSVCASFEGARDVEFPTRPDHPVAVGNARLPAGDRRGDRAWAEPPPAPDGTPDAVLSLRAEIAKLRVLAIEADDGRRWTRAQQRHQDRVAVLERALGVHGTDSAVVDAVHGGSAGPWYDYGRWCCGRQDVRRGAECLREAIAIDQLHVPSLTLYAAVQVEKDEHIAAATFIDAAVQRATETNDAAGLADARAVAALTIHLMGDHEAAPKCLGDEDRPVTPSLLLAAGAFAARCGLAVLGGAAARAALACAAAFKEDKEDLPIGAVDATSADAPRELLSREERVRHTILMARLRVLDGSACHGEALELLEAALEMDENCAEGWVLLGHLRGEPGSPVGDEALARGSYQTALRAHESSSGGGAAGASVIEPLDPLLPLRYADLCLAAGEDHLDTAEEMYLRACRVLPTASTWAGVGVALLRKGMLEQAEEALSEANIRDNRNPTVWAWLSLLCMLSKPARPVEADQAFEQALLHGIADTALLTELGGHFMGRGKSSLGEAAYRRALQGGVEPAATSGQTGGDEEGGEEKADRRVMLAEALVDVHRYEDALEQYRLVTEEAKQSSAVFLKAEEGLTDMSKKLGYGKVRPKGRF